MRILILGGNGYLGWPQALYLNKQGHAIHIVDGMNKQAWEAQVGVSPLLPIRSLTERAALVPTWRQRSAVITYEIYDIAKEGRRLYKTLDDFKPDTIIHYAEQPSAPYSHLGRSAALFTQLNNLAGTLNLIFAVLHSNPLIHIVKLGTMGEYGTPNIPIEEGWLDVTHKGREDRVLYPKKAGSFYHLSKVHDSHNLEFACRILDLRVTDLNQGIVYGVGTPETRETEGLHTSFHYDAVFGTVLNRFLVQAAVKNPLTVYGSGGQTRGFLDIRDTLRCVELAALHPAEVGEFRVFNQFTQTFSVLKLAEMVSKLTGAEIKHIENPRVEAEEHFYEVVRHGLLDLGLEPHLLTDKALELMYNSVQWMLKKGGVVDERVLEPEIRWRGR